MKKIVIVGGGACGMMAAAVCAKAGADVTLLERNEKLGKKIYITGKGRCNFTNAVSEPEFFESVFSGKKFAYSAVYGFNSFDAISYFESCGMPSVIERGARAFPASQRASDVTKALASQMQRFGARVRLNTYVKSIRAESGRVTGVLCDDKSFVEADNILLACGGKSYPLTGSDGSGYALAKSLGHTINRLSPALVPLVSKSTWVHELSGLSLKNIEATLFEKGKAIKSEFGEMLFTHSGLSGPVILSLSCHCEDFSDSYISIDLKPALDEKTLDNRILRDFDVQKNKSFKNSLDMLLPKSLAEKVVELSRIDPETKVNSVSAQQRKHLCAMIKGLKVPISSAAGFNEAIITKGGVNLKEINPKNLESKLISGLYLGGEMLDMHGYTGGFNLQLAFSCGQLAAKGMLDE